MFSCAERSKAHFYESELVSESAKRAITMSEACHDRERSDTSSRQRLCDPLRLLLRSAPLRFVALRSALCSFSRFPQGSLASLAHLCVVVHVLLGLVLGSDQSGSVGGGHGVVVFACSLGRGQQVRVEGEVGVNVRSWMLPKVVPG